MDFSIYDSDQTLSWSEIEDMRKGKQIELEPVYTEALVPVDKCGGLRLHVLGSGSKGNCCVIEGPEGALMIDAGFSKKVAFERLDALKISRAKIKAILLTHEHSDHTKGLGVLSRGLQIPVYCTQRSSESRSVSKEVSPYIIHSRDSFDLAGIHIQTFPTSHDAREPIGFRFEGDGDAVSYVTDTGNLSAEAKELLSDARLLALESNHDPDMLKNGPYPYVLKQRIASETGHLSNVQAFEVLSTLISSRTQTVIGMHLSETNNKPDMSIKTLLPGIGTSPIKVYAARQNRPISYQ